MEGLDVLQIYECHFLAIVKRVRKSTCFISQFVSHADTFYGSIVDIEYFSILSTFLITFYLPNH